MILIRLLAGVFLASTALCTPTPQKVRRNKEIIEEAYGPLDAWKPIFLIDVDPNAILDGLPVNDTVIYSYEPPSPTEAIHKRYNELTAANSKLSKRKDHDCYDSPVWVPQSHLYSAKDQFCGDINNNGGLGSGQSRGQTKNLYKAADGSYQHFMKQDGTFAGVWYWIKVRDGFVWIFNNGFDTMFDVIWNCPGRNPNSAGGYWNGHSGGAVDGAVDTVE